MTNKAIITSKVFTKRLWHRCFPVNFANFLRTPFCIEDLRWLVMTLNTRFLYKNKPYKNIRLQRPKSLEHAKNIAGQRRIQRDFAPFLLPPPHPTPPTEKKSKNIKVCSNLKLSPNNLLICHCRLPKAIFLRNLPINS